MTVIYIHLLFSLFNQYIQIKVIGIRLVTESTMKMYLDTIYREISTHSLRKRPVFHGRKLPSISEFLMAQIWPFYLE